MKLYDRNKELAVFEREIRGVEQEQKSRFIVVSGRRRVGKTRLVLEAFAKDQAPSIYLFCYPYAVEREIARQWMNEVCQKLELPERYKAETVGDVIEVIFEEAKRRRINLFIDEIQNMLTVAPSFFGKLRGQWDKLTLTGPSHLLMTQSGSVANVVKQLFSVYSQPLYGRMTARVELKPFSPAVLKEIFADYANKTDAEALLGLFALTGGVAKYVETLITNGYLTLDAILEEVTNPNSYFWSEGQILLANEFKTDYGNYFCLLQKIAHGVTKGSELQDGLSVNISGHLRKLETDYGLIAKSQPLFAKGTRGVRYKMTDRFLIFWFRFIQSNQQLIGSNNTTELRARIRSQWENFSGRALEQYFLEQFLDSGKYTHIGQWWDRKGENEIDLIAVNANAKTMEIFEIKRNPKKIDLERLAAKAEVFVRNTPEVKGFKYTLKGLSLEDL